MTLNIYLDLKERRNISNFNVLGVMFHVIFLNKFQQYCNTCVILVRQKKMFSQDSNYLLLQFLFDCTNGRNEQTKLL